MSRWFFLIVLCSLVWTCSQREFPQNNTHTPFLQSQSDWVDSVLLDMSLEEKIGQLIFLRSNLAREGMTDSLVEWSKNGNIGGLILEQLPLSKYVQLWDSIQQLSTIPLLNGTWQSSVLNNQFSDLHPFPLPSTIASMQNDSLERELSDLYLRQCKNLNIHFALAPKLRTAELDDTQYDFQNWEGDPLAMTKRSTAMLRQLQEKGILAVADSFEDLIYFEQDTTYYVDSVLQKYQLLTLGGLSGMLIDPELFAEEDTEKRREGYLQQYLKDRLDFDGLLFGQQRDSVNLERLIYAGADVFLVDSNVTEQIQVMVQLVKADLLSEKRLNESVYKVLMAKNWVGLEERPAKMDRSSFALDFYNERFPHYVYNLHERALQLLVNPKDRLPLAGPFDKRFRLLQVGNASLKIFNESFEQYADYRNTLLSPSKSGRLEALKIEQYKWHPVVVSLDQLNLDAVKHRAFIASLNRLSRKTEVVCVNFGNPLNLQHLDTTMAVVQVFERTEWTEHLVPQLLFGAIQARGQLPLTIAEHLPFGQQIISPVQRLKYTIPEEVGIAAYKLVGIDALVKNAIASGITPGAQVMVVKEAKVIYQKSFGHQTYDKKRRVQADHLYDIASITKIAATTLSLMKLYEKGRIKLKDPLIKHLPFLAESQLKKLSLKRLMIHQSGLQPNMPIAEYILYEDSTNADCNLYFCQEANEAYNIKVADSMFMHRKWVDSLWQSVYDLEPRRRKRFRYSDVNFNLLQKVVELRTGKPLDEYVRQQFFDPLGLRHCAYRPLEKFSKKDIVPTAHDERWRKQVLRGYVHDESAALLGGVGGNAGLFSNSNELAIIAQLLLNGGTYGGQQFFEPRTVDLFTSAQHGNHRGLGFDLNQRRQPPSCSKKASKQSFGHTGFTGTCLWVDPKYELIFIFLTNRISPDVRNRRIFRSKIRSRIHNLIYEALDTYDGQLFSEEAGPEVKRAKLDWLGQAEGLDELTSLTNPSSSGD